MIDVLNKHFQNLLHISKAASGFVMPRICFAYVMFYAVCLAFEDSPSTPNEISFDTTF